MAATDPDDIKIFFIRPYINKVAEPFPMLYMRHTVIMELVRNFNLLARMEGLYPFPGNV